MAEEITGHELITLLIHLPDHVLSKPVKFECRPTHGYCLKEDGNTISSFSWNDDGIVMGFKV